MNQETFSSLLPKFVESLREKGRSPSTILAYKSDLEQLANFLAKNNKALPSQVKPHDLESFRDYLLAQKYTPKSTSRKLNAIKTFYRWLKDNGGGTVDPSKDVSHPKIEAIAPKFLSPLEYRALRDVVRGDFRIGTIIELILQTGMRISEVANLKMPDVKKDRVFEDPYASQPERTVPLNNVARVAIEEY